MATKGKQGSQLWAALRKREFEAVTSVRRKTAARGLAPKVSRRREDAVALARSFAEEDGAGYVVRLDVIGPRSGPIPPWARLCSAIAEDAEYRRAIEEKELARAEKVMGMRFTPKWRAYLRQPSWFSRGWMKSGAYVVLYTPSETAELVALWAEFADRRGMLPIGNDGAGENLTIDARETRTAVTLTLGVSTGWEDSVVQHGSIAEFITAIEARTFDFKFGVE